MKSNNLVTCVILCYKKFQYVYQALDSILMQDYPNIELILSDDSSPNFEKEKIQNYISENASQNISNVIINHNETNVGTVQNLNRALKLSSGNYIVLLSSDDMFYDKTIISRVVDFFKTNTHLIATGYRDVYSEDMTEMIAREPQDISWVQKDPKSIYEELSWTGNFIAGACTYFTREFLEKYGYFDDKYRLLEDYPKYLSITRQGCKIGFFGFPTIKYRQGGMSNEGTISPMLENDIKNTIENEILAHPEALDRFLYRRIKYRFGSNFLKLDGFRLYLHKLSFADVVIANKVKRFLRK